MLIINKTYFITHGLNCEKNLLSASLNVDIEGELELEAFNAFVWLSSRIGIGITVQYQAVLKQLPQPLPRFRAPPSYSRAFSSRHLHAPLRRRVRCHCVGPLPPSVVKSSDDATAPSVPSTLRRQASPLPLPHLQQAAPSSSSLAPISRIAAPPSSRPQASHGAHPCPISSRPPPYPISSRSSSTTTCKSPYVEPPLGPLRGRQAYL